MEVIFSKYCSGKIPQKNAENVEGEKSLVSFKELIGMLSEHTEPEELNKKDAATFVSQILTPNLSITLHEYVNEEIQETPVLIDTWQCKIFELKNYIKEENCNLDFTMENFKNIKEEKLTVKDFDWKTPDIIKDVGLNHIENHVKISGIKIQNSIENRYFIENHLPANEDFKSPTAEDLQYIDFQYIEKTEEDTKKFTDIQWDISQNPIQDNGFSPLGNNVVHFSANNIKGFVNKDTLMEQITETAKIAFNEPKKEIEIQMNPESLGRLSFRFTMDNGILTGKISVINSELKEVIQNNLNDLKESLSNQGISVGNLEVFVGQQNSQRDWTKNNHILLKGKNMETIENIDKTDTVAGFTRDKKGYVNLYGGSIDYFA